MLFHLQETLLLSYNELTQITPLDFVGVQKLQRLDLNANRIRVIHSSQFYSTMYRTLRHLDLSENGLEYMGHNAITDLRALEYLKLANNNLPSFDTMHFQGLHKLKTLILDMNPLGQLKNDTFKPLYELETLSMISVNARGARVRFGDFGLGCEMRFVRLGSS